MNTGNGAEISFPWCKQLSFLNSPEHNKISPALSVSIHAVDKCLQFVSLYVVCENVLCVQCMCLCVTC